MGMTTFGASGPAAKVYEHFGFVAENVADRARAVYEKTRSGG
jgi:transketolase